MGLITWLGNLATRWWDANPSVPVGDGQLQPSQWLSIMQGPESFSGKSVTANTARSFVPFWACVKVLSESIGSLPMVSYERVEDGKRRAPKHSAYRLLHDEANPHMTAVTFRELMQSNVVTWGNAYAKIDWDGAGRPVALWPMSPDRTEPVVVDGNLYYVFQNGDGSSTAIADYDILHIHGLGDNGYKGFSVVSLMKNAIGAGVAAEEFGSKMFAQGVVPGLVLKHPGQLSKDALANLRASIDAMHAGSNRSWRPFIAEEGMDVMNLGIPPEDAQFLETRKFQAEEMARWFRIPPHFIGVLDNANYSNVVEMSLSFVKYTLAIWLKKWEQECTRKLFKRGGAYFAEFLLDDLLRADPMTRANVQTIRLRNGTLSRNEARAHENQNPVPGGDVYYITQDLAVVGPDGAAVPVSGPPADPPADPNATNSLIIDAHRDVFAGVIARVLKVEKDRLGRGDNEGVLERSREALQGGLAAPVAAFCASLKLDAEPAAALRMFCDMHVSNIEAGLDLTAEDEAGELCSLLYQS